MKIELKDALYIHDMVQNIRNTLSQEKYEDYESFDSIDEIFASCNDIINELVGARSLLEIPQMQGTMSMLDSLTITK